MTPPTFNGAPIFGAAWHLTAGVLDPYARQVNEYPGLDGVEVLRHGRRTGRAEARGRLGGYGPGGLRAAQAAWRAYQDGRAYVLVDQFGWPWPYTELETFRPVGPIVLDHQTNVLWQAYEAAFIHWVV